MDVVVAVVMDTCRKLDVVPHVVQWHSHLFVFACLHITAGEASIVINGFAFQSKYDSISVRFEVISVFGHGIITKETQT